MRAIAIIIQGLTGKKIDYSSLPNNKVHVFSVETVGVLERDYGLDFWFSGLGKAKFEFTCNSDIRALANAIGTNVMD